MTQPSSPSQQRQPAGKPARKSFRETQFQAREEAIVEATNRLLSSKGYDTMVMDDIASEVGIAKGSLYKHFESKEALAAAVMIRLLRRTHQALRSLPADLSAYHKLEGLLTWTLRERLAGGVPHLPSTSSVLRDYLINDRDYVDELMSLSDEVGELIDEARTAGDLRNGLDDSFVLYYFYARSCDPTLDFLKAGGAMNDEEIVSQMVITTMAGIAAK